MIDHLEELRKRIIISLASVAVFAAISFYFSDVLLEVIAEPIKKSVETLYFSTPYEAFLTRLHICFVVGFAVSIPVIFAQFWSFISPGLYQREKKAVLPLAFVCVAFFLGGVAFCYFLVLPMALKFFLGFGTESLQPLISIGSYISFTLTMLLIFGLMFDAPVVLVGLIYLGILKTSFLRRQRKIVIVAVFVIAAILTPTIDIVTQSLLAVPMWLLFEAAILVGRIIEKPSSKEEE